MKLPNSSGQLSRGSDPSTIPSFSGKPGAIEFHRVMEYSPDIPANRAERLKSNDKYASQLAKPQIRE
jgi:hypothetical protein